MESLRAERGGRPVQCHSMDKAVPAEWSSRLCQKIRFLFRSKTFGQSLLRCRIISHASQSYRKPAS